MGKKVKEYLDVLDKSSVAFWNDDDELCSKLDKQADKIADTFSKQDWLDLISQETNTMAKIHYAEKMNAKFPPVKTNKENK